MQTEVFERGRNPGWIAALCVRAVVLTSIFLVGSLLADRPAMGGSSGSAAAAAAVGAAGGGACSNNSGRALYDCVAGVLDRMSNAMDRSSPETQRALQTAASQLRSAANKNQALSAITQCRTAIAGALRQMKSAGLNVDGLNAISGVLAQTARLILTRG